MKHPPCVGDLYRIIIQFSFSFIQHFIAKCGVLFCGTRQVLMSKVLAFGLYHDSVAFWQIRCLDN